MENREAGDEDMKLLAVITPHIRLGHAICNRAVGPANFEDGQLGRVLANGH